MKCGTSKLKNHNRLARLRPIEEFFLLLGKSIAAQRFSEFLQIKIKLNKEPIIEFSRKAEFNSETVLFLRNINRRIGRGFSRLGLQGSAVEGVGQYFMTFK